MRVGERIYNLERMFNLREGLSPKTDTLPKRFLTEELTAGPAKNPVVPLESMLKDYYAAREWGKDGIPEDRKLKELGLERLEGTEA